MIALRPAAPGDLELYRNLLNILHSESAPFTRELDGVDARGYFDYSAAEPYFSGEEGVMPFIIELDGRTAGLAAVTCAPYAKPGCDFCLQELMVLPRFRGQGVATQACRLLARAHPGRWCLIALTGNVRAVKFCQDMIASLGRLECCGRLDDESAYFEFTVAPGEDAPR